MKYMKYIFLALIVACVIPSARAHAIWTYNNYTITYTVGSVSGGVTVDPGPNKTLVQPNAGISGITGTASSTAGSITSTSWSYVGCMLKGSTTVQASCPRSGMVVSGASGASSPLVATMANMDNAAAGTVFIYQFSATDSAGNTASAPMYVLVTPPAQPDLTATYDGPTFANAGTVTLNGTVTNSGGADATPAFTSYFEVCSSAAPCGSDTWTNPPGITLAAGLSTNRGVIAVSRVFNPASTTTYQARLCADGTNAVAESNENNNCSGWTALTINVTPPPPAVPTASISANPTSIASGGSSSLSWTCSSSATSCTGSGFNTGGSYSGTLSVSPTSTTTYSVTASNTSGSNTQSATVTVTGNQSSGTPLQCSDGQDNDGNGKADWNGAMINGVWYPPDPGCTGPNDPIEAPPKPSFIEF